MEYRLFYRSKRSIFVSECAERSGALAPDRKRSDCSAALKTSYLITGGLFHAGGTTIVRADDLLSSTPSIKV